MTRLRHHLNACTAAAGLVALASLPLPAEAGPASGPSRVIFTFAPGADGSYQGGTNPYGGLIADSQGRLYGATQYGGQFSYGVVFRLTRPANGKGGPWTEEVLHSFGGPGSRDSGRPNGLLLFGSSGEIYGTTFGGPDTSGAVYRLDNKPGWPITILHTFLYRGASSPSPDGSLPQGGLQFGPGGLLYGTTYYGGPATYRNSAGTIFSVSPQGDSKEYAVLHRFTAFSATDGYNPTYGLTPAGPNRFYGTTLNGGDYAGGTVFSFSLENGNEWVEKVIFSLGATYPVGLATPGYQSEPLALGAGGVLYGCAIDGGLGYGGVFSLTPPASSGGPWTESDLYYSGASSQLDGKGCQGVMRQPSGQLLGTTAYGGRANRGTIFQLSSPPSGQVQWTETLRYDFSAHTPLPGYDPGSYLLRIGSDYFGEAYDTNAPGSGSGGGSVFTFRP